MIIIRGTSNIDTQKSVKESIIETNDSSHSSLGLILMQLMNNPLEFGSDQI